MLKGEFGIIYVLTQIHVKKLGPFSINKFFVMQRLSIFISHLTDSILMYYFLNLFTNFDLTLIYKNQTAKSKK